MARRLIRTMCWTGIIFVIVAGGGGRSEDSPTVKEIESPAGPGSGEPNLTVAPNGRVLLSWIEPTTGGHALRFSSRRKGQAWSKPQTIAAGDNWFVNWADFPSTAVLPDGLLNAHWLAKSGPGTYAYDVHIARSSDGGNTWSKSIVPHRDGTRTEHGFVSMFPWIDGQLAAVWLDGRKMASGETGVNGPAKDEMTLMFGTIGSDGKPGSEVLLDGRVCECCQTSATVSAGVPIVVYRDRSREEIRDIFFVRYKDGRWSKPQPIHDDGWEIYGCPVNGPAISAEGTQVAVAWFAAPDGVPRVRAAFSQNAGETFGKPIPADDGNAIGRVDVQALPGSGALVSWMERTEEGAEIRARRIRPDGTRDPSFVVAQSSVARATGFPRMDRIGNEVVFAWTDSAKPSKVRTAILKLRTE